jgi:hypothetical protein
MDNRKARKAIKTVGFVYSKDGWPIAECSMLNVSESGTKIMVPAADDFASEFLLSLSRDGRVRRQAGLETQGRFQKPTSSAVP